LLAVRDGPPLLARRREEPVAEEIWSRASIIGEVFLGFIFSFRFWLQLGVKGERAFLARFPFTPTCRAADGTLTQQIVVTRKK
jgi:hypothetical protein